MRLINFIIINIFFTAVYAQEFPILSENSLPGIEKIKTGHFDRDELWGYINGGADLYFEYGFTGVTVQEISIDGSNFKADLYLMNSPLAAYGIFSVSRFRCQQSNLLNHHDCVTPYQYIAAKANYFISIANQTGSEQDQEISKKLARLYLDKIDEHWVRAPEIFSHHFFNADKENLKYITGPLGMQNGFVRWDGLFSGSGNYEAWIMPANYENHKINIGLIRFQDPVVFEKLTRKNDVIMLDPENISLNDGTKYYAVSVEDGIVFIEGDLTEEILSELKNLLQVSVF